MKIHSKIIINVFIITLLYSCTRTSTNTTDTSAESIQSAVIDTNKTAPDLDSIVIDTIKKTTRITYNFKDTIVKRGNSQLSLPKDSRSNMINFLNSAQPMVLYIYNFKEIRNELSYEICYLGDMTSDMNKTYKVARAIYYGHTHVYSTIIFKNKRKIRIYSGGIPESLPFNILNNKLIFKGEKLDDSNKFIDFEKKANALLESDLSDLFCTNECFDEIKIWE